jgi:hypothetical protein
LVCRSGHHEARRRALSRRGGIRRGTFVVFQRLSTHIQRPLAHLFEGADELEHGTVFDPEFGACAGGEAAVWDWADLEGEVVSGEVGLFEAGCEDAVEWDGEGCE